MIKNFGLGQFRLFLAFLVVISHLWKDMIHGPAAYAVWGFYVLSGYLITLVLNEKYDESVKGLIQYFLSRIFRILPLYYIACFVGLIAILYSKKIGFDLRLLNPAFARPETFSDYWVNITLLPFVSSNNLLVPVSGALATEFAAYLLMPVVARSRAAAAIGLIFSICLNYKYGSTVVDFVENFSIRYSSFLTCYMAFSIGALTWQYRDSLKMLKNKQLSLFLWLAHCLIWIYFPLYPWVYGIYVSLFLTAWVVISIVEVVPTSRLDGFLGDISYPMYLFHTTVSVIFLNILDFKSFWFFVASLCVTLLISILCITIIEPYINLIKGKLLAYFRFIV